MEFALFGVDKWGTHEGVSRSILADANRALKKSITQVGIERHIRVHDLRHTAASLALLKGIPGKVVQGMLGHSHYSTTMDIYSHVDQSLHREASQKMNAVLGGL